MLSYLTLKNFKCFEEQSFALGNLTIVAGANGAGKSTCYLGRVIWTSVHC